VKGLKSRLLTDLIRLLGTSPFGIGYTIERAELTAKDNKYQLIDSFTKLCQNAPPGRAGMNGILKIPLPWWPPARRAYASERRG